MSYGSLEHGVLAAESRAELLAVLRASDRPLTVAEIAQARDLSPATARFHLNLLVSAGLVERSAERRATAGRPVLRYEARSSAPRPEPDPELVRTTDDYEQLARLLAGHLSQGADPTEAAKEAGRRWSRAVEVVSPSAPLDPAAAVAQVLELMDGLGFAPDHPAHTDSINLRRCPFEAVAREHRQVVCGVHQGMLEETFKRLGGSVEVAALEPFAVDEPLLCVVNIRRATPATTDSGGTPHA
jgi:predicted ArsR family transcriptional regulator